MRLRGSVPNPGIDRAMFVISGVEKPVLMLHDGQSRLLGRLALISLQWEPVQRCYACTGTLRSGICRHHIDRKTHAGRLQIDTIQ